MRFKKSTLSAIIIFVALATIVVLSGLNFVIPQKIQIDADRTQTNTEILRESAISMNKIFLTTKDNIKIAADFYPVESPIGWLVLIHMMPATKESWQGFAQELQTLSYESIAIDLRGHGESDAGPNGYKEFSDVEHQKSILDLEAAVDYLIKERRAVPKRISFIGASIGANLSLQYIGQHPEFSAEGGYASGVKTAILLSPGLNYRGIQTEPLVKNLKSRQRVFFVSSRDDGSNAEENQKLYESTASGVEKQIKIYETAGHGTRMLEKESGLKDLIFEFLK